MCPAGRSGHFCRARPKAPLKPAPAGRDVHPDPGRNLAMILERATYDVALDLEIGLTPAHLTLPGSL